MENSNLIPFDGNNIRKIWHNEQWFFSVVDIIAILTDSVNPRNYWTILKKRENQLVTNCHQLKMPAADGKSYKTDCANTEGVLRIVMSVPSLKAEPFKLWLAEQGKRSLDEIENPELAIERAKEIYKAKGYTDEWIESRIKAIDIRKQLTDEWQGRGVKEGQEYSFLTAEIAKGTFGLTPSEHKGLKGLSKPNQNLRDHMTNLELIFTALGEEITRKLTVDDNALGFEENRETAIKGGSMAGQARLKIEELGMKVVSNENFLHLKDDSKEGDTPKELQE